MIGADRKCKVGSGRLCAGTLLPFVLFAVLVTLPGSLTAQTSDSVAWRVGAALSGGLAIYSEPVEIYDGFAGCGTFADELALRIGASFFYERPVSFLPFDLVVGFDFEDRSLDLSRSSSDAGRRETGERVTIATEHRFEADLYRVALAVGGSLPVGDHIRLGFAPSIGLQIAGDSRQYEAITSPLGAVFTGTDQSERPVDRGGDLVTNSLSAGLSGLLGFRFDAGGGVDIEPRVRFDLDLAPIFEERSLRTSSASVGLAVMRRQNRVFEPPPVAPTPPSVIEPVRPPAPPEPEVVVEAPYLEARITAWAVDERGTRTPDPVIEIREAPYEASLPLLPQVFFEFESAEIPERYILFETPEEASRFDLDSLGDVTPELLHRHLPNVVGQRMRERPEVSLRIRGTLSGDEESAATRSPLQTLARSRAEALRRYLVDVWQIDARRVRVTTGEATNPSNEARPEGRAENRRAELLFDGESLARPVVIERMARIASPPSIVFDKQVIADTNVTTMTVTVEQGGKTLLRFVEGDAEGDPQEQTWPLSDMRVQRDVTPIIYRFEVEDVTGGRASDTGTFRVIEQIRRDEPADVGITEYLLAGFRYNSSELSSEHVAEIYEIARELGDGDLVEVTGFTDRVGDEGRNRTLARVRAQNVADALADARRGLGRPVDADRIIIRGSDADAPNDFDNALPEGRIFSRMVRVTILRDGE